MLARGLHTLTRKTQSQLKQLKHLTDTDALTGLSGRHNYDERAETLFKTARRQGENFGVIVCDIDYFKLYNDTYGHGKGDMVIKKIADVLLSTTSSNDLCFRIGGEEFVVLMKVNSSEDLLQIAERMRCQAEALRIPHVTKEGIVTLSVGAILLPPQTVNWSYRDAFNFADKQLYTAKHAGRNKTVFKEVGEGQRPCDYRYDCETDVEVAS